MFQKLQPINITSYKSKGKYQLISFDGSLKISDQDIEDIVRICNEQSIYNFIFKAKLNNEKYTRKAALSFINFAWNGWRNNTHFVFIIKNEESRIVGALDIKSFNLDDAEIGYWLSAQESGVMTNAVTELIKLAQRVGYKKLSALVSSDNNRSQGVLQRNNFINWGPIIKDQKKYIKYEIYL